MAQSHAWAGRARSLSMVFTRANCYSRHFRQQTAAPLVCEPGNARREAPCSERQLQCIWYDPYLRPAGIDTDCGEPVTVEDPGIWNLEAGPDFLGAALRIGREQRRISGDVEIHMQPSDWERHGHAEDTRYSRVRVHVTYWPGSLGQDALPPGCVRICLKDHLKQNPMFSFDNIDVAAYPHATPGTPTPCSRLLSKRSPDEIAALLDAAGEERLRRKSERMAAAIEEKGEDQVLYEEIFCALGYKHNKAPFRHLAELIPLQTLREISNGNDLVASALLLGIANLLPQQPGPEWDEETRAYVRKLWDCWWRIRNRWEKRIMQRGQWRLSGIRPTNRPERRLGFAASLFCDAANLSEQWKSLAAARAEECISQAASLLHHPPGEYWARRLTFSSERQDGRIALLGKSRIDSIMINVFIPFIAAVSGNNPFPEGLLDRLPLEPDNGIIEVTANSLLGPDHAPSLYRNGLRRQGLIQIFHDFCVNDRSRCAKCSLPTLLADFMNGV